MYMADFETTTKAINPNKSWVWLWGIKGFMPGDEMLYDCSIKSFMDTVSEKKMSPVLFHNLAWDFNYIYKYLLNEQGFKFVDSSEDLDVTLNDKEFTWLCDHTGTLYSARVKWKGFEITFKDSLKVLMSSVDKLGKSINLDKLGDKFDYDHYHKRKEDLCPIDIEYLERDIDIVIETFSKATAIVKQKLTRAGMAYEHFREFYGEREFANDFGGLVWNYKRGCLEYENILTKDEWNLIVRSYQGGYTNWNKKYTDIAIETPNGVSYDVNSLYPAVMENNKMPYGRMYNKPPRGEYITLLVVNIFSAKIKDEKYPPLFKDKSKKIDAKYLTEVSYEERVLWEEEFEFIKQYYDIDYAITKKKYFKVKYVFADWLAQLKENKIQAKDKVERDFWKGIYNSLYGKFGQHYITGSRVIVEDGKHLEEINGEKYLVEKDREYIVEKDSVRYLDGKAVTKLSNKIRYGKNKEMKHEAKFVEGENFKYIPIASYTTWKARETLWKAMFNNLDIWIYSDTDSCYFSDQPKGIDIHESRFGAWKAEHKYDIIKVLRAKCYMYHSIAEWGDGKWNPEDTLVKKISGVSASGKKKINWDNFYLGSIIENGKRGTVNVEGGKFVIDSDYKLGSTIDITSQEDEDFYNETKEALLDKLKKGL